MIGEHREVSGHIVKHTKNERKVRRGKNKRMTFQCTCKMNKTIKQFHSDWILWTWAIFRFPFFVIRYVLCVICFSHYVSNILRNIWSWTLGRRIQAEKCFFLCLILKPSLNENTLCIINLNRSALPFYNILKEMASFDDADNDGIENRRGCH